MTSNQFYDQLLQDIQVDEDEMKDARTKRDDLAAICCGVMRENLGGTSEHIAVGALAQGTQIKPLNDVDLAITFENKKSGWEHDPEEALEEIAGWIREALRTSSDFSVSSVEPSSHAIKIEFDDETFTADVVPGTELQLHRGLSIPHCPKDDPSDRSWIPTNPAGHRDRVKQRNRETNYKFARQLRILKWWNRYRKMQDQDERKPVSSFHMTALALTILDGDISHGESTAEFFERAAVLVQNPLPTPSGLGSDLVAKDPGYAAETFSMAADRTRAALFHSDAKPALLAEFGDPKTQRKLLGEAGFSIGSSGALLPGLAGSRPHQNPRSHGDGK